MKDLKLGTMRVWHIANPPSNPKYFPVETIEQAKSILNTRITADLKDDTVTCNAFGLEIVEDIDNGPEWCEYYDEGGFDIMEIMDEEE